MNDGGLVANEDDYFKKLEQEKVANLRKEQDAADAVQAIADRKKLHWNCCGKCGAAMDTHHFRGVEIEICPECGAVLLDKGELQTLAGEDQSGFMANIAGLFGGGKG